MTTKTINPYLLDIARKINADDGTPVETDYDLMVYAAMSFVIALAETESGALFGADFDAVIADIADLAAGWMDGE